MAGLIFPCLARAATLSPDGFESPAYIAGPLGSQGGWVSSGLAGTSALTVSGSQAYAGSQSLYVYDGDPVNRPKARYDFGANTTAGNFDFSIKEDPATAGRDLWRVDFFDAGSGSGNFTLILGSGTSLTVSGGTNGSTPLATVNPTTTSYNPSGWNTFRIGFDNTTKTASIYLNGASTPVLSTTNVATNWSVGRVELSVSNGSGTNQAVYYDNFKPEWETTNKLKYAPPTLVAPTVVNVPAGGYFGPQYSTDEDVIIHFPTTGTRTGNQNVYGGRNLRIIGGDMGSKPFSFYSGPSQSLFLEGVKINTASGLPVVNGVTIDQNLTQAYDAIDSHGIAAGTTQAPTIYVQNCFIGGPHGVAYGLKNGIGVLSITCTGTTGKSATIDVVTTSAHSLAVNNLIVLAGSDATKPQEFNDSYVVTSVVSSIEVIATRKASWLPFVVAPSVNDSATGGYLWGPGSYLKHADCFQCMNDGIQNAIRFYKVTMDGSYQCFIGGHALDDTEARGLEMTRVNLRVNDVWPQSYSSVSLYLGDTDESSNGALNGRIGQFAVALDRLYVTPRKNLGLLSAIYPSGSGTTQNTRDNGAVTPVAATSADGGATATWPLANVGTGSSAHGVYGMTVAGAATYSANGFSGEAGPYLGKDYADPNSGQSDAPGAAYVSPGYSAGTIAPLTLTSITISSTTGTVSGTTVTVPVASATSGATIARTDVAFSGAGYIIDLTMTNNAGGLFTLSGRNINTTQQLATGSYSVTIKASENGNPTHLITQNFTVVIQ